MKILYYSSHPNLVLHAPSGYGTHMREMIAAFKAIGHEVHPVIVGGIEYDPEAVESQPQSGGIKKIVKSLIPSLFWESMKDFRTQGIDNYARVKLLKICEEYQPDLIYERAAYIQTSGIRVAKELSLPHVLEINAPMVEERVALGGNSLLTTHAHRAEVEMLQGTDKVCIVSSILRDYYSERCNVPHDKFQVTPNAINMETIAIDVKKQEVIRATHGFQPDDLIIGFVGSIFPWHGVDLMIQAFYQIHQDYPKTKMLVVGDGEIRQSLMEEAQTNGLEDKIVFTGNVPHKDVFSYIDLMDITVLGNSHWYGSPIKIFEYGAMKKAIIAPDREPVKEVIEHNKHGLIISASVNELAKAFRRLIKDDKLRDQFGNDFHQKIITQHTWEQMAHLVLSDFLLEQKN